MKNGKFKKILATAAMGVLACVMPFIFTGCDADDDVNVRVEGDYVQWQVEGSEEWNNLLSIEEIKDILGESCKGETGVKGEQGEQGIPGIDGREVEFRKSETHIQWRYVDGSQGKDENWEDLVLLSSLKGQAGQNYIEQDRILTLDYNLPQVLSNFDISNKDIYPTSVSLSRSWYISEMKDYWSLPDFLNTDIEPFFKGWFTGIGVNERQLYNKEYLPTNTKVYAIWDTEEIYRQIALMEEYFNYQIDGRKCVIESLKDESLNTCETPSIFINDTGVFTVYIKDGCFDNATNLEKITLGTTHFIDERGSSYIDIPCQVFDNCAKLEEVKFSNHIRDVQAGLFSGCVNLKKVTLSTQTNYIWQEAFLNCKSLENIYLPESVQYIDYCAFSGTSLREIYLPSRLRGIGAKAFAQCENLTKIIIPSNINYLDDGTFEYCISLSEVIMPSVKELGDQVFWGCENLRKVDTEQLEEIGSQTFNKCKVLSEIVLGESLQLVDAEAFYKGVAYAIGNNTPTLTCFLNNENQTFIINNQNIANSIIDKTSWGYLLSESNCGFLYIKSSFDVSNSIYLLENYTKQTTSEKEGYDYYIKNNRNKIPVDLLEDKDILYLTEGYELINNDYIVENFEKQETSDEEGYDMYLRKSIQS